MRTSHVKLTKLPDPGQLSVLVQQQELNVFDTTTQGYRTSCLLINVRCHFLRQLIVADCALSFGRAVEADNLGIKRKLARQTHVLCCQRITTKKNTTNRW